MKRFRCTEKHTNMKEWVMLTGTLAWSPCTRSARELSQAMSENEVQHSRWSLARLFTKSSMVITGSHQRTKADCI